MLPLLKFFATPLPTLVVGEKIWLLILPPPPHFRNAFAIAALHHAAAAHSTQNFFYLYRSFFKRHVIIKNAVAILLKKIFLRIQHLVFRAFRILARFPYFLVLLFLKFGLCISSVHLSNVHSICPLLWIMFVGINSPISAFNNNLDII